MSKIFEYKAGSLLDQVSGSPLTNSGVVFKKTEKGVAGKIDSGDSLTLTGLNLDVLTIISNAKGTGTLRVSVGANNTDTILTDGIWEQIKTDVTYTSETSVILTCTSGTVYLHSTKMFSTTLTTQEINQEYKDFLNAKAPSPPKRNFAYEKLKPNDLSKETDLEIAYDFNPSNGELVDISGNRHTGTINEALSSKDGIYFNGTSSNIECDFKPNDELNGSDFTLLLNLNIESIVDCNWIGDASSSSRFYIGLRTGKVRVGMAGSILTFLNNVNTGVQTIAISFNYTTGEVRHSINGEFQETATNTALKGTLRNLNMILNGVSYYHKGEQTDFRLHKRILTQQEIKDYNNEYAEQVYFTDDFSSEFADGTNRTPLGWIKGTGTFKFTELTSDDAVLTHFKKGTKMLECVTAGSIAFQSKQAYGTWEFDINKANTANTAYIYIIADSKDTASLNGYAFKFTQYLSHRIYFIRIRFIKITAGSETELFSTNQTYVNSRNKYGFKIERTSASVFSFFIKGKSNNKYYELMSSFGGVGSNPVTDNTHTTSNDTILNFDAESKILNIKYTKGIKI